MIKTLTVKNQFARPWLLLLMFTGFLSLHVKATHVVGSDVTYQCTGTPDVYHVTFKIYRDCSDGYSLCPNCPSPGPLGACNLSINVVGAASPCQGTSFGTQAINVVLASSALDVISLCSAARDVCTNCASRTAGTFVPGIEVYTFEGDISLAGISPGCCMVYIGYQTCCRNGAITTLAMPLSLSFFTQATINRCASPCNSSPTFTNDPVAVTCAGQDFTYNLGAIDPDGDSLSYAFGQSLVGPGSSAPYQSPYSPTVPFPYLGAPIQSPPAIPPVGISIDPISGDLRFRPFGYFVANLVIEVSQWKYIGGVPTLMGVTRRDIQFYSQVCPANFPPVIRTYDANGVITSPQPNFSWSICANQQLCFFISAWDNTDPWDTTDLSWNNPYNLVNNGATFVKAYNLAQRTTQGPRLDSMKFCWTPPVSMAQNLPYYFVANAKDRACPLPSRAAHSFSILVRRIPLAVINKINKNCGYYDFTYTLQNSVPLNPSYTQYLVETSPHSNTWTTYNAQTVSNHRFTAGGWHRIKLRLTTTSPPAPNGCPNDNIIDSVNVPTPVDVAIRDTANCFGVPVTQQATGHNGIRFGIGYRYTFYAGNLSSQTVVRALNQDSNFTVNPTVSGATTHYKVVITDLNGCQDSAAFAVLTRNLPLHETPPGMRLCYGTSDTLDAGNSNNSVIQWRWTKSPVTPVLADTFSQKIVPGDSGRYVVRKTDGFGCMNYDTSMIYVNPQVPVSAGPNRTICAGDAPIDIQASGTTAAIDSFQWRQVPVADPTIVLSRNAILSIAPPANTTYQVRGYITYGGVTCSYVDSMDVVVKPLPVITRPSNISLCKNAGIVLLPNVASTNKPGQITSVWSFPPNPTAMNGNQVIIPNLSNQPGVPPANPAGNIMRLKVTDVDGCKIFDSLVISLFPVPVINAGPRRKFCDYATVFDIKPGTQLYSPNGGILANNELWFGNGIYKPNPNTNTYAFNPKGTGVRTGNDIQSDSNIITYVFNATFPSVNPVSFTPAVSGFTASSPSGGCPAQDTVIFEVIKTPILEAGVANAVCKSGDSVMLDTWMNNRSTTAVNPLTSYWYIGAPDQAYRPALTRGRVFLPRHPVIETYTRQYVLVYADTSTTCRVADTSFIQVNENPYVDINYVTATDSALCTTAGSMYFSLNPANSTPDPGKTDLTSAPAVAGTLDVGTGKFTFGATTEGLYNVKYHYTDPATGCDNRDSINIRLQEPPQLEISSDQTVCEYTGTVSSTLVKIPANPYSVAWSTSGDPSKLSVKNNDPLAGADYVIQSSDVGTGSVKIIANIINNGVCAALADTTNYTINPKPLASFTASPDRGCVDDRHGMVLAPVFTSAPTGAVQSIFKWFDNDVTLTTPMNGAPYADATYTKTYTKAGKHHITLIVDAKGCTDTATADVEAWATPFASFTTNPEATTVARPYFDFINTTSIDPDAELTYTWKMPSDKDDGAERVFYNKDLKAIPFKGDTISCIPIWLTAISEHGCADSLYHCVRIEPDITVFIPNAFRPKTAGADGSGGLADCANGCNQTFKVVAQGYQTIEIFVYNRWGQLVFKTNNPLEGWDGKDMTTKQDCQQDAYIYQINAVSYNNKKYTYSGSVTLLR